MASRYELNEAQWERVKDFLPGRKDQQLKIWVGYRPASPVSSLVPSLQFRAPALFHSVRRQQAQAIHTVVNLRARPAEHSYGVV